MAGCEVIPLHGGARKIGACAGKCMQSCHALPRVWVLAACEGCIAILHQNNEGELSIVPQQGNAVAPSIEEFRSLLRKAAHTHEFDQLVIIGSTNDIAWVQLSLPQEVVKSVVAEIKYPLMPAWFKHSDNMKDLARAIGQVLKG